MRITIVFGIILLLALVGCSKPTPEDNLRAQGIPDFTIKLLKLASENCNCEFDDVTFRIVCICSDPSWDKNIRAVCSSPPVDEYDAVQKCFATIADKEIP